MRSVTGVFVDHEYSLTLADGIFAFDHTEIPQYGFGSRTEKPVLVSEQDPLALRPRSGTGVAKDTYDYAPTLGERATRSINYNPGDIGLQMHSNTTTCGGAPSKIL